jgi:hypothetical protein
VRKYTTTQAMGVIASVARMTRIAMMRLPHCLDVMRAPSDVMQTAPVTMYRPIGFATKIISTRMTVAIVPAAPSILIVKMKLKLFMAALAERPAAVRQQNASSPRVHPLSGFATRILLTTMTAAIAIVGHETRTAKTRVKACLAAHKVARVAMNKEPASHLRQNHPQIGIAVHHFMIGWMVVTVIAVPWIRTVMSPVKRYTAANRMRLDATMKVNASNRCLCRQTLGPAFLPCMQRMTIVTAIVAPTTQTATTRF